MDGAADTIGLDGLEERLAVVCGQLNALHAELVSLVTTAIETDAWAGWGIHTPAHWLAWKAGLSRSHGGTLVRLATRRAELPITFAAFERGELTVDQVAVIATKAPAWADRKVCELAQSATVSQLRSVLRSYPFDDTATDEAADVDAEHAPPPAESEFFGVTANDDASWRVAGRLDADHGLIVDAAFREARDALTRADGRLPTGTEVLVEIARRSLEVTGTDRRDRFRVHVHLDERHELVDPFGHCLAPWIRDLITCDTTASILWTRHGRPIATGTARTTVPGAVRRHVLRRDRHCRVPGCGSHHRLDVHHVVHREHGGDHRPGNLIAVCPRHHRMHHRGELTISGDAERPDGLTVRNRHGTVLEHTHCARPPTPGTGLPAPGIAPYQHPTGERFDTTLVDFHPSR
jgi:hypothetical protein